ncbi:hypothetical protein Mapa_015750 [Marchantia paleacea]|nr:hypothetical protein Mapa_015750 [Marchantia paleacea]
MMNLVLNRYKWFSLSLKFCVHKDIQHFGPIRARAVSVFKLSWLNSLKVQKSA